MAPATQFVSIRAPPKRKMPVYTRSQLMTARPAKYRSKSMKSSRAAGRGEKKVIDINTTSYAIENTGTQLQLLNGVAPGTNDNNRIGRRISLKSLQIHGLIGITDSTTSAASCARMIIVYDKQPNAAAPTFANIIQSQNIAGTTASDIYAMVNLDNRDRFEIIRDKWFNFGFVDNTATQAVATSPSSHVINEFIKLGNRETTFNAGTAGTIADITSGSLYCFLIGAAVNSSGVTGQLAFRVRFMDA